MRRSRPRQAGSWGLEKAAIAAHSMTTTDAGAKKTISESTGGHSSCARICRWSTASRAPSVGGATGAAPPAARVSTAHSTSSTSRRTVTARARSIQAPAVSGAATGRRLRARSHESSPSRYTAASAGASRLFRSSATSARALRGEMPSRSRA